MEQKQVLLSLFRTLLLFELRVSESPFGSIDWVSQKQLQQIEKKTKSGSG